MGKLKTLATVLKNDRQAIPQLIVNNLTAKQLLNWLPDAAFLKLRYRTVFHKKLNLKNPETFSEKLQWMKLYDRRPEHIQKVDKYRVRQWVAEQIGSEHLIPLLGKWDRAEDIDFDSLPDQFVLKCNHDSGCVLVCTDKATFDIENARKRLNAQLETNLFWWGREWPYKNVKPCIIAEQFLQDESGELKDYKVHCFDGEPRFILICQDRFKDSGITEDFYTPQWERMRMKRPGIANATQDVPKPEELESLLELSRKLAKGLPFARTDFYIVQGKLYFGEVTFFPAAGLKGFEPDSWDATLGSWITLPEKTLN